MTEFALGRNARYTVENGILTITVDLSKNLGNSESGKSVLIANSGGHQQLQGLDDGRLVKVNLTVSQPH